MKRKKKPPVVALDDVIFYHLRKEGVHNRTGAKTQIPYATVAINRTGVPCRGIAICSESENFDKAKARSKAYARLKKAAGTKETDPESHISRESEHPSVDRFLDEEAMEGVEFKVCFSVSHTAYEAELLTKQAEKKLTPAEII